MNTSKHLEWTERLRQELKRLQQKHLFRTLETHKGKLDFSSNDYLSLNANGVLSQLLVQSLSQSLSHERKHYIGSTASRLIRGHYEAFDILEETFAKAMGSPSALFFNSGYAANIGALPAIIQAKDQIYCDRLCHASLLDGIRLSQARRYYFHHNDLNHLEERLKRYRTRHRQGHAWIVSEAIFSMDGDSHDLQELCRLAERYEACIYLDEAHSLGVRGKGKGLAAEAGVADRISVSVFPCGKAPGLAGAFVCGPKELKPILINKARSFIYSTALPPFLAQLLDQVFKLIFSVSMEDDRKHLQNISSCLRHKLKELGYFTGNSSSQIIPLIIGEETKTLKMAKNFQEAGFDVRAVRPPSVPSGSSRLRISLQAARTKEDLDNLCQILEDLPYKTCDRANLNLAAYNIT